MNSGTQRIFGTEKRTIDGHRPKKVQAKYARKSKCKRDNIDSNSTIAIRHSKSFVSSASAQSLLRPRRKYAVTMNNVLHTNSFS